MTEKVFRIEISLENDIFQGSAVDQEISRLIRLTADHVQKFGLAGFPAAFHDVNGNYCCRAYIGKRTWNAKAGG